MSVMNGLDATRVLKRVMPDVPVIVVSAYGDSSTEKEAGSAGVSAGVSRYEHISVLLSKARRALEPQQLQAFQPLSASSRRCSGCQGVTTTRVGQEFHHFVESGNLELLN
jgi:DNA-binding NarL/FixJ family response regulator